jgi:hypothetical protein
MPAQSVASATKVIRIVKIVKAHLHRREKQLVSYFSALIWKVLGKQ